MLQRSGGNKDYFSYTFDEYGDYLLDSYNPDALLVFKLNLKTSIYVNIYQVDVDIGEIIHYKTTSK